MIATSAPDALHLGVELADGTIAYVDADWVPEGNAGTSPALILTPDGSLTFAANSFVLPDHLPADEAAAVALEGVVQAALGVVAAAGGETVEVIGLGIIASRIRDAVGATAASGSVDVVVDLTGDSLAVGQALARLRDGGTLVLAGESAGRTMPLDLYPDVHRRAVCVIGVPRPLTVLPTNWRPSPAFEPPATIRPGEPLVPGARWYRVEAA